MEAIRILEDSEDVANLWHYIQETIQKNSPAEEDVGAGQFMAVNETDRGYKRNAVEKTSKNPSPNGRGNRRKKLTNQNSVPTERFYGRPLNPPKQSKSKSNQLQAKPRNRSSTLCLL